MGEADSPEGDGITAQHRNDDIPTAAAALEGENSSTCAATRILISISINSRLYEKAWSASEELILLALEVLRKKQLRPLDVDDESAARLVATERCGLRTMTVFDIWYDSYSPDTAHLPGRDSLPVLIVSLGRSETASKVILPAHPSSAGSIEI